MENKGKNFAEKIRTVSIDRRHFLKYVAAVSSAAAMGSVLAGCGGSSNQGSNGGKIAAGGAAGGAAGVVIKKGSPMVALFTTMANDYYKGWNLGAEQAVKALDMKYEAFLNEGKPETELSQMETKVSQGAKMIFVTAPDPANIPAMASTANSSQAYFANTWETPDWYTPFDAGEYYVAYFIPPQIKIAYELAKVLFETMGGQGNLVHISGWPGGTPDWQRTVGLQMALKEYPKIKLLASQPGKWNRIDSRKVMEDMITTYPKIDGIFGQNDDCGIGGMTAAEERNLKIPVVGIDGNKETMELIKAGRFTASCTSFPFWQAGYSAVKVFDAFHGWKPSAPERMMFTDGLVVNKDNVNAYYDKFYKTETLPIDWKLMSRVLHPDDWDPQNLLWPIDPDEMWQDKPKPKGWNYPGELKSAKDGGEFAKIKQLYADHYKKKLL